MNKSVRAYDSLKHAWKSLESGRVLNKSGKAFTGLQLGSRTTLEAFQEDLPNQTYNSLEEVQSSPE